MSRSASTPGILDPKNEPVLIGTASVFALFGAWWGSWVGMAAVGIVLAMALGLVLLRRRQEEQTTEPVPLEAPVPEQASSSEDTGTSGLNPLPLVPTESVREDGLGQVWRQALDACIDGLLITGPDERVLYLNPAMARILSIPSLDVLGVDIVEFFPGLDDEENSTAGYRRTGGDVLGIEWRTTGVRGDGTTYPAEVTINPLDELGMGVYQVRDIRDRVDHEARSQKVNAVLEELRNQALEASHAKSTFLANMSHELRTPLNAILGYSEMLSEELEDERALKDLGKVRAAGRHLMSLINTILDLSKIEAGRMELFMETVSVPFVVKDVLPLVQPLVDDSDNTFVVDGVEGVGRMVADRIKLQQILVNLIGNALKFTSAGTVTLRARRDQKGDADWIVFDVIDTGIGVAPEKLAVIFEEFDQGDGSTTRMYGGSGLGLSISRRFCQMMGGDIDVVSVQGEGSTFTVRLPANTVEEEAHEPEVIHGALRVLVIDDDPGVRELIARTLAANGYQVHTASTGREGLARAREFAPDLVTLDVRMPGMDGWQVLGAFQDDEVLRDVPVVMLSMVDERRKGYALGATAYLTKPIDRSRLLTLVGGFGGSDRGVLIVDDDPDVRDIVRRTLEPAGFQVREAVDGVAGLEAIRESMPGLVLLDLMMPRLDGFGMLDALAADPDLSDLPVVVLSAMDLSTEARIDLESRVDAVLQKASWSRDELLRLVRDRVAHQARDRNVHGQNE